MRLVRPLMVFSFLFMLTFLASSPAPVAAEGAGKNPCEMKNPCGMK